LPYHRARLLLLLPEIAARYRGDPKKVDAHQRAQRLERLLASIAPDAPEADVPPNSLFREFIGGGVYHY
jgi:hypothetical protein